MTPAEMGYAARAAKLAGIRMTLTRRRGAPKLQGFPRGELLCENHDGRNVYSYDPAKVLAWLEKNALVVPSNEQSNAPHEAHDFSGTGRRSR